MTSTPSFVRATDADKLACFSDGVRTHASEVDRSPDARSGSPPQDAGVLAALAAAAVAAAGVLILVNSDADVAIESRLLDA
mmetsp:Transcript_10655/g.27389  ORF Transcript_10655/g.27389 Transcript_10655/m.27389 type:complete len:81 (+) Transcript_10655:83-325(+)